jgi:glutathione S-transferase
MPLSDAVLRLALYVDFRLTMLDDEVQDCIVERQAILYYFSSTYPKPTFFWDNHAQDLESRARNRAFRDQLNEERRHRREQRERRE